MSPPVVLGGLQTEERNPSTLDIDRLSTLELCRVLNHEDSTVPSAVEQCIPVISEVIDALSERVRKGGRVFYIGAGTSGRLGVLDASEIPPTYSAPTGQFIALMAGGDYALRHAKEGAEDDRDAAQGDLGPFNLNPTVDTLIGIASSGRTPYVLGGLNYVKGLGATTVAVVCVSPSAAEAEGNADYVISAVTGPEAVTGSTRMKAGTATKLVLNMISTGIMIKLGKTYGNLMIDVKATNLKLKQRARNILRFVGGYACMHSDTELDQILSQCSGSVKLAAVRIVLNVPVAEAKTRLERNHGVLARVFDEASPRQDQDEDIVLCVDAGGTSCKAVILTRNGDMGAGVAGPCNVTNTGIGRMISTISEAIQQAVDNCNTTRGRHFRAVKLTAAWVGMAGYGRPSLSSAIDNALRTLLPGPSLKITTDIDLLPLSIGTGDNVVVVVAGTGSVAMSYEKVKDHFQRTSRVGGWGGLLGDDGSGYWIGREALRTALLSSDMCGTQEGGMIPPLSQAVFQHFSDLYPGFKAEDLLSTVLAPSTVQRPAEDATLATTKRIAGVAKVVLSLAESDVDARRIIQAGVSSLAGMVSLMVRSQRFDPSVSGLVLAGGMMQDNLYKASFVEMIEAQCGRFKQVETVAQPAIAGAQHLLHLCTKEGVRTATQALVV
ncbi:putative glucokinase regulator family protein [Coniochaeta sp. 2T2.1]|nr:putative glucokinase regulator family protein [Coniochaeta sp. 2T2.1]